MPMCDGACSTCVNSLQAVASAKGPAASYCKHASVSTPLHICCHLFTLHSCPPLPHSPSAMACVCAAAEHMSLCHDAVVAWCGAEQCVNDLRADQPELLCSFEFSRPCLGGWGFVRKQAVQPCRTLLKVLQHAQRNTIHLRTHLGNCVTPVLGRCNCHSPSQITSIPMGCQSMHLHWAVKEHAFTYI